MATIQKKVSFLTAVDYAILRLVHEYHFLTVSQVTRLRYSSGSETTCQDRLKRLFDAGVLLRRKLPHMDSGNTNYLYYLSTLGQKELQPLGITNFPRVRKQDIDDMKLPHLEHLRCLNDVLIAARLLSNVHPDITLISMQHDLDLKRSPMRVTVDRQGVSIVPDGFLDFRLSIAGHLYALPVWVELDRGTEWGETLKKKLRAIICAVNTSAFEGLFDVSSITVAIATTEGEKRVHLMRSFVQQELTNMGLTHLANSFLFAALPPDRTPQIVFLSPLWYTPDNNTPVPLLDLSEE